MAWPTDQIDQAVQPNDAQRAKLDALQSAAAKRADTIKAACPTEVPATPPAASPRTASICKPCCRRCDTIRPALHDFYNSLSDDQKARFNTMGKQLFAQTMRRLSAITKSAMATRARSWSDRHSQSATYFNETASEISPAVLRANRR